METGTSRCTGIPVEATEIPVKRDKLCPYKRNIPVQRDEVQWNLKRRLTRENLPKRKQKETTFVGMLFRRKKLVFVLLTNYYQLFPTFPGHPGHPSIPRSYKPRMKYVSGNRDIPVHREHINRPLEVIGYIYNWFSVYIFKNRPIFEVGKGGPCPSWNLLIPEDFIFNLSLRTLSLTSSTNCILYFNPFDFVY